MSLPLQSIDLIAPGFKGLNTEDSPLAQDPTFAEVADNAVIDKRGRIASRKGINVLTTNKTALGSDYIHKIHQFYDDSGNNVIFSTGNNRIMTGTTTLVNATPGSYSINANNWKIVNFNNKAYFFQRGLEPLVYDNATGLRTFGTVTSTTTSATLKCNEAIASFGRLWIADNASEAQTIYWSDLLDGVDFTGGSSGSINVSKAWPDGHDVIVGLVAHNNLLVIFGEHSLLVYQNADTPAVMSLADTVSGIGGIDRGSIQSIGTDVLFLSDSGLRSLGRTIQEKSLPLSDLSKNVKTDLILLVNAETDPIQSVFSPENAFYLLCFPSQRTVLCFDLKIKLENNAYRVTRWTSVGHKSFGRDKDGTLYIGSADGIGKYDGYHDNAATYQFRYISPGLTFGSPSKTKLLKKIRPTLVGLNDGMVLVRWAFDFSTAFKNYQINIGDQNPAFFGVSEYGVGTFTGGLLVTRTSVQGSGNGGVITIGIESSVNGAVVSIQEINVLALVGKTI
tara:strand:+ start:2641 stop:4158 length:1518 start_codon:yes stop_codon:yes gene_type:complete